MWVAFNLLNASAARADKVRKMSGFSAPCQCRWKSWSTRISRASFLLLQLAERTIQAGMLQRKTPLVRMSEIARVSKLLESSQKPVTLKAISEFFDQAGRFEMNKFVPWQAALKSQTIWRVWICSGFGWESTSADKGGVREGKEFSRWQTFQFFKALLSNLLPPYSNKTLYINRLSFKRWTNDLVIVMEFIGRWRLLRIIFTFISWHFAGQVSLLTRARPSPCRRCSSAVRSTASFWWTKGSCPFFSSVRLGQWRGKALPWMGSLRSTPYAANASRFKSFKHFVICGRFDNGQVAFGCYWHSEGI